MIRFLRVPVCERCRLPMRKDRRFAREKVWSCESRECGAFGIPVVVPSLDGALCVEVRAEEP